MTALVEALRFQKRDTRLPDDPLEEAADYWEAVRRMYRSDSRSR